MTVPRPEGRGRSQCKEPSQPARCPGDNEQGVFSQPSFCLALFLGMLIVASCDGAIGF